MTTQEQKRDEVNFESTYDLSPSESGIARESVVGDDQIFLTMSSEREAVGRLAYVRSTPRLARVVVIRAPRASLAET